MMNLFKNIGEWLFESVEAKVLFLGLDSSGKTSIFNKIEKDLNLPTIPCVGFRTFKYNKATFDVHDIDGKEKIRQMWKYYYQSANAIAFIVDSGDTDRFKEAGEILRNTLDDELLKDFKVLVWANKQDLPSAANIKDITNALQLNLIKQEWTIQPCCSITGEGIFEGLSWIASKV